MKRILFVFLGILLLACFPASAQQGAEKPKISTGIPEGFEDLLEAQLTLVDIYYLGERVGSSMATYTPEQLSFESPQEVLSMLNNIEFPSLLLPALAQSFDTNASRICFYQGQPSCGVLAPDDIAIIFDESQLRVDVFVNPKYQIKTTLKVDKYLPESTAGPAMINALSFAASGGDEVDDQYTARLNSLISFENYRILSDIESDQENGTRLDRLSLIYEYRNLAYQAGSFRSLSMPSGFYPQRDFLGVRIQNSLASRTDLEQVSGTEIFIFLSERSRVELYKDGQLLDTQIYQPGNIQIDTRELPEGAYNIELKVVGDSGRERTETRFYSKSLLLPPKNETLYFFEAGYPEEEAFSRYPEAKEESLIKLGMLSRPTDFMGWSANVITTTEQSSIEVGSYWLGNQIDLQTSHAINDQDEYANYYLLNLRNENFMMSASYRRTHSNNIEPVDNIIEPAYQLISPSNRQTTFSFGMPVGDGLLNLFARTSEGVNQEKYEAIGLSWRKNIYRGSRSIIDWTMDLSEENDDQRFVTGITWRFGTHRLNFDSSANYHSRKPFAGESSSNIDKRARVTYRDTYENIGRMTTSVEVNDTEEQSSAGVQAEINSDYGYGRVTFDHIKPEADSSDSRNNYTLTSRFNFVAGGGDVALGGARHNQAGVMLNLESIQVEGLEFAVLINNIEVTRVKAGSSSFVALAPYQSYQLSLTPRGEALVQFDNSPRKFTLYPGNVEKLSWDIETVKVVVFQLMDHKQEAFANARLQSETIYARSDELGWVQMELSKAAELSFKNANGDCRVVIASERLVENINFLGSVSCQASIE